jgi:hypothetical protein
MVICASKCLARGDTISTCVKTSSKVIAETVIRGLQQIQGDGVKFLKGDFNNNNDVDKQFRIFGPKDLRTHETASEGFTKFLEDPSNEAQASVWGASLKSYLLKQVTEAFRVGDIKRDFESG